MLRKWRHCHRLLVKHWAFLKTTAKLTLVLTFLATLILYYQTKGEKETLINLALGSGRAEQLVQPRVDTLVLNGYGDRKDNAKFHNPFFVIVVTSSPENTARRNIIRSSWGKETQRLGVVLVFFLGMPSTDDMMGQLSRENTQFNDLLIDDFHESYYALTTKTLRLLKYFKFHHPKSKFLVKTDDDVFINVPNLGHYLFEVNSRFKGGSRGERFVGGVIHSGRGPHTWNPFSKWYAPADVWTRVYRDTLDLLTVKSRSTEREDVIKARDMPISVDSYPPYAEGNFYVLSDDVVSDILNVSRMVRLYHLEDVYVTGVIAHWGLGVEQTQIEWVSSASNFMPRWSYFWYKLFVAAPSQILAYHCDKSVDLIPVLYEESRA